jgi:acetylornithine/succinyldiaminopimelate/putrescine aminotransferase
MAAILVKAGFTVRGFDFSGSTFGGNPIGCAAAIAALQVPHRFRVAHIRASLTPPLQV